MIKDHAGRLSLQGLLESTKRNVAALQIFQDFSFFSSIFLKKEEKENTLFSKDLETTW